VSVELVGLALLMGIVTYPSRAVPLLAPGIERLPARALEYLRLLGPAVLAALAAVNALVLVGADGVPRLDVGIAVPAVLVCVTVVAWRRNLLLGLLLGVSMVAVARAAGLA